MPKKKALSIKWSARAVRDLDEIASYIARDKPTAARKWIAKLRKTVETAARAPFAGRVVPEVRREDVREVFLKSYRIVYGVRDDHIIVFTVFGGGKQLAEKAVPEQ